MALKTSSNKSIIKNENFSTSEIEIGKWLDGKTIYRKTIVNPTLNSWNMFNGVSNIDKLINAYGSCEIGNQIQPIPRVVPDDETGYGIGFGDIASNGNTILIFGTKYSGQPTNILITFEYTKK